MPSLIGVAREWDADKDMRERIRQTNKLLAWENPNTPKTNIDNASRNLVALKPLARRLREANGDVGMHSVPDIIREFLDRKILGQVFAAQRCLISST